MTSMSRAVTWFSSRGPLQKPPSVSRYDTSAQQLRRLTIEPFERGAESRNRRRQLLRPPAGDILQLTDENVADARSLALSEVLEHRHLIPRQTGAQLGSPERGRQHGRRVAP